MVKITFTVTDTSKKSQNRYVCPVQIAIGGAAIQELFYWSLDSIRDAVFKKATVIFKTEQIFRDVFFDLGQPMLKDLKSRYQNITILK